MDKKKIEHILMHEKPEFFDAVKLKGHHKSEIIIIDDAKQEPETITVNEIQYKKRIHKPLSSGASKFAILTAAMGAMTTTDYVRKRPNVDIAEEFGRIQRKESKLSRSDRQWVENQFNYEYEPIKDR